MTTPTQMPESLKVPDTPHGAWLWEFLDGTSGYMGVFFGEPHPKHGGRYWWRRFVREEVSALQSALKDRDAEIERLKKDAERSADWCSEVRQDREMVASALQALLKDPLNPETTEMAHLALGEHING